MPSFKEYSANIMQNGLARTNRFQVLIPLPTTLLPSEAPAEDDGSMMCKPESTMSKLKGYFGEAVKVMRIFTGGGAAEYTRGLELMCSQTEMPGKTINTSETKYNGDVHKIGHSLMYGNHQFTFKVSQDMFEKTLIDSWMNLIINPATHEITYMKEYAVNINVFQLDQQDKIVHAVSLIDAFPVMMNPLTLSNNEHNNTHELMVQFAYRRWVNLDLDAETGSALDSLLDTPLGPYLAPILTNPVVQRGLEYVKEATGLDLEGEAMNIYNQVDDIVKNTTGESINKSVGLLNSIKTGLGVNGNISVGDQNKLFDFLEGAVNKFKP